MSKKLLLIGLFLLISTLGLCGCGPSLPTCDPGSLEVPELVYPDWREIVNGGTVELEWSYPDSSCEPEEYEIILSQERDYSVLEITDTVAGSENTYSPSGLDIAEEYFWRVRARVGTTYSPYSYELRSFFTEPVCDPGDLAAPIQTLPLNMGIFDIGFSSLEWEWPVDTCIPSNYKIEVSTASDLSITTDFGATSSPGTRWGFGSPPTPATQYYWRVAPYADGVLGPFSEIWTFYTDPICSPGALIAPVPLFPTEGTEFLYDAPFYEWSYPDTSCTPMGYHLLVSATLDFSSTAPIVLALRDFNTDTLRNPNIPLENCEDFYWKVAAMVDGIDGPWSTPIGFTMNAMNACTPPTCDPSNLPIPDLIWPEPVWTGNYDIVSLNPALEWSNPGPCIPDGYQVKLADLPDNADPSLNGDVLDGAITTYTPPIQLLPARQYWWHVFSTYQGALSNNSNYAAFFTEPECGLVADLLAPEIIWPIDGEVIDTLQPMFSYEQSLAGCIPDHYLLNLQTIPDFSGVNLFGEIAFPATSVGPGTPLADCTMYYLKVAGVQDGTPGPYSDVVSFFTDEQDSCMPAPQGNVNQNVFCKPGPGWQFASHLFENGDPVWAVGRNDDSTYIQVLVPDETGLKPKEPPEFCWIPIGAMVPFDSQNLLVKQLPDAPDDGGSADDGSADGAPICHSLLKQDECKAAGGTYNDKGCTCPSP
jgi:hypothetical protein